MQKDIDISSLQQDQSLHLKPKETPHQVVYKQDVLETVKSSFIPLIKENHTALVMTNDADQEKSKIPYAIRITSSDLTFTFQEPSESKQTFVLNFESGVLTTNNRDVPPHLLKKYQAKMKQFLSDYKSKKISFFDEK